jgi:hypothetical protein
MEADLLAVAIERIAMTASHESATRVSDLISDDGTPSGTALIAFSGDLEDQDMSATHLFDLAGDQSRRIAIRGLLGAEPIAHPLGNDVDQIRTSLDRMLAGHEHLVTFGIGMGGFYALLFGALLDAASAVVFSAVTSVESGAREARALGAYADIPTVWQSHPPRNAVVNYRYREDDDRWNAERLAPFAGVLLEPYYEHDLLQTVAAEGVLRRLLRDALAPRGKDS